MHITLFIGSLAGGGAERVVSNLSNYLFEAGNEITILTMTDIEPAYKIKNGIKIVSLYDQKENNNLIIKNIKRLIRLRNHITKSDTSVYIVMLPITIIFLLLFRSLINVPIIVSERGDPKTRYKNSKLHFYLMKKYYPLADNFVFQTKESKNYYITYLGDRGEIIPNAINEEFIRPEFQKEKKKKIIASGRLTEQKNFEVLIRAFAQVNEKHPDFDLEILGEGEQRKYLEGIIKELNLQDKITLPGYVNNVIQRLEESSIFVLTSNFEGMPNALIEAMALGLPCISTDCPIGGPKYLIKEKENGILIPLNDQKELTKEINLLIEDIELSKRLGENARKITDSLAPNIIYSQWLSLIEKTIKNY